MNHLTELSEVGVTVGMLKLKHSIDKRRCYDSLQNFMCKFYFFNVIVSRLAKLLRVLSEIQYVIMYLESNTKMRSKVKQLFLGI